MFIADRFSLRGHFLSEFTATLIGTYRGRTAA